MADTLARALKLIYDGADTGGVQLRLGYDETTYFDFAVDDHGDLAIVPSISGAVINLDEIGLSAASFSGDGSDLTALNADELASGTVPLARLADIADANIAAGAAIDTSKLAPGGPLEILQTDESGAVYWGPLAKIDIDEPALMPRVVSNGTPHAPGDYALSAGWGSTAAVDFPTALFKATDMGGLVRVTANGAGIAANPTVTLNFKDGNWPAIPMGVICVAGSATGYWSVNNATAGWISFSYNGLPVAGGSYSFSFIVLGRP